MCIMHRILKVSTLCPYQNKNGKYVNMPFIPLKGRWLEELGFTAGCTVEINGEAGIMLIKVLKQD